MATAEGLLRCVFDGCLSVSDIEIERRPYHRNCSCALHKSKGWISSLDNPGPGGIAFLLRGADGGFITTVASPLTHVSSLLAESMAIS
ncbi:hypothetical protein IFM89_018585 [Coptis chinensis]|uniref:Uncharacterized protein n=1 Tax=Coptis chinensis TaxID=261450 RepID=A0A835M0J1_9MAGN|nr:hypothetical protein IFM89_018585 [Coptis chinensis]